MPGKLSIPSKAPTTNVSISKWAALEFCELSAHLCGPQHLGLGEADSLGLIQKNGLF